VAAIAKLKSMEQAAMQFTSATKGWSEREQIGLYFHVYGWNSVNALHLHIVDLADTGPTFQACEHKNLPLTEALKVFEAELKVLQEWRSGGETKVEDEDAALEKVVDVINGPAKISHGWHSYMPVVVGLGMGQMPIELALLVGLLMAIWFLKGSK